MWERVWEESGCRGGVTDRVGMGLGGEGNL